MVAVLAPHPTPAARRPALRLVPDVEHERRPTPRSVTPPPRLRPSAVTYWRRRVVVLLALTSLAIVAHLVVGAATDHPDERSVITAPSAAVALVDPSAAPAASADAQVYVVRPGDTVWSIAASLQPEGDVRPLVDQLTERAGGSGLQAGQRIALDGLGR